MMSRKQKYTKYACYMSNISMAVTGNLSPLLFITFHSQYGISYTLLGFLVLINFFTQLLVDLVFSFFSYRFNIKTVIRSMPMMTAVGLLVYSVFPCFFPQLAYFFVFIGTVIFSVASGLSEVLTSPVIAALPSDNPDRDMSFAHSAYAWGVVGVVLLSTLYMQLFGRESWFILSLLWTVLPICTFVLFLCADIPDLDTVKAESVKLKTFKNPILILCVLCIFFGGASEVAMAQWCSGYLEAAYGIDKLLGDILGVSVFSVMLGLGRTLYGKFGKNISRFLLLGFIGASVCYLTAALSSSSAVGLIACAVTGFCVSMLWPGTLIYLAEMLPGAGVVVYALLAAGGDLGGSVAPQLMGSITDIVSESSLVMTLGLPMNSEQLGFKFGMFAAAIFPIMGIVVAYFMVRFEKKASEGRMSASKADQGVI